MQLYGDLCLTELTLKRYHLNENNNDFLLAAFHGKVPGGSFLNMLKFNHMLAIEVQKCPYFDAKANFSVRSSILAEKL